MKLEDGGLGLIALSVDADGPGAGAGVKQGDVIIAWNGEPLRGNYHLMRHLGRTAWALKRAGEPLELDVTIRQRPPAQ